jgi:hypothetical protein
MSYFLDIVKKNMTPPIYPHFLSGQSPRYFNFSR